MTKLDPIAMAYRDTTEGFAKGWYCVAESAEVADGEMKPVNYLDRQLIVYRDQLGGPRVADAFCPHMGAHLASFDGHIADGQLVCPFHKWRFDGATGKCVSIPYSDVVPPKAKLGLYPTLEMSGMIMMWWHPRGEAPDYTPLDVTSQHADRKWLSVAEKIRESRVPFRDLFENLLDTAHIQQLHGSVDLMQIDRVSRTEFGLRADYAKPGRQEQAPIEFMQCNFSGLGFLSQVILGDGFGFIQNATATPIDRERLALRVRMYIQDTGSEALNDAIGGEFTKRVLSEIDQDLQVLDYKKHIANPLLCAGDGPILKWRQYTKEMYL